MVDPLVPIVTSAIGAATGVFAKDAIELTKGWIANFRDSHLEKAEASAEVNAMTFIGDLTQRIGRIEAMQTDEVTKARITGALDDPDFAQLLRDAVNDAARTSDKVKTSTLARLVSERLLTDRETLTALATRQAVAVVPLLTQLHLSMLGFLAVMHGIRPLGIDLTTLPARDSWVQWWKAAITESLPLKSPPTHIDAGHLAATSCVTFSGIVRFTLDQFLYPGKQPGEFKEETVQRILNSPQGETLQSAWTEPIHSLAPTSVGLLIGIHVHDEVAGNRTRILW